MFFSEQYTTNTDTIPLGTLTSIKISNVIHKPLQLFLSRVCKNRASRNTDYRKKEIVAFLSSLLYGLSGYLPQINLLLPQQKPTCLENSLFTLGTDSKGKSQTLRNTPTLL